MRLLMWLLTILFALGGVTLRVDGGFIGAGRVGLGLLLLAFLSCPFLWAPSTGLVPDELALPGKRRLMLALALILASPLLLPWQLWL